MILPSALWLLVAVAIQAPAQQGAAQLQAIARDAPESVLVEAVRHSPMDARAAWRQLIAAAGGHEDSSALASFAAASRLAGAVAVAWRDSFLVRQVARFRSLTPSDRRAGLQADSVWLSGRRALGTDGPVAAMPILRESLRRFEALADTSGIAAALNALGAAFHIAQQDDSATAYETRAGDLARRVGDLVTLGSVSGNLGNAYWRRGDLDRATESFARTRQIFEQIGHADGIRMTQLSFGLVAWERRDLGEARRSFEAGLAASRIVNDSDAVATFLGNLAGVTAEDGDYETALPLQREAIAIYRASENWPELVSEVYRLGQIELRRGDYPAAVRALSEAATILRRIGPARVNEIDVRMDLAQARASMGDLQGAYAEVGRAEAFARRRGAAGSGASLAKLAVARGDIAAGFNRFAEAAREYDRALRLAPTEPNVDARHDAMLTAQLGMAGVLLARGSYQRARVVLEQVQRMPTLDRHDATMVRVTLSQTAVRLGDTTAARRALAQALDTLRALGAVTDEAVVLGRLGDLEAQAGRALPAESLYRRGLALLGPGRAPGAAWPLHAGLAGVLRRRGALDDAAGELRAAIAQIERISGALALEEQRSAFRADKWDPYVQLALVERARGRTEVAFETSEALRARQMLDLLARGRVGEVQATGGLANREQDLRRRMTELSQPEGPVEARGLRDAMADSGAAGANDALTRAQDEYAALLIQMHAANPAYAAFVRGDVAPAPAVKAALAPDEALLEYLVGDSTTVVFVVTRDSVSALDLHVSRGVVQGLVDFTRSALGRPIEGVRQPAWRPPLRRLYAQLVGPVEVSGLLQGKRHLLIAPHAELHYVPFAALLRPGTGSPEQFLVERYILEYVPSASVWLRLRDRPESTGASGVLALAPRPATLPGSQAEVAAIRRTYGGRALGLVGRAATESAFRALAPQRDIVHLATHGVLNKRNPLFSFVQLSAGGGEDGRLEVHEIFGLTLNARLLVLSACETGVGAGAVADVPPGDDWIGLVQGFLYAGAGNVLATLWPVSDVATAEVMERFYGGLAGGKAEAEALALAQRATLRHPATAHPFFWAGLTLVRGR